MIKWFRDPIKIKKENPKESFHKRGWFFEWEIGISLKNDLSPIEIFYSIEIFLSYEGGIIIEYSDWINNSI